MTIGEIFLSDRNSVKEDNTKLVTHWYGYKKAS